jgi:hypothetical protein
LKKLNADAADLKSNAADKQRIMATNRPSAGIAVQVCGICVPLALPQSKPDMPIGGKTKAPLIAALTVLTFRASGRDYSSVQSRPLC